MRKIYEYADETLQVLRNTNTSLLNPATYTETCGENAGKVTRFLRCVPHKHRPNGELTTAEERRAICQRVVKDCNEPGLVIVSNNPEYGGDYVRVDINSRAYDAICYMKS